MKLLRPFAAIVVLLLASTATKGGYSIYSSITTGSYDPSTGKTPVYTDVTVSGASSMYNPGAQHTPRAYNLLNGAGGWLSGGSACTTCYISVTNGNSASLLPNEMVDSVTEGEVDCTAVGVFAQFPISTTEVEPAITKTINNGLANPGPPWWYWNVAQWCTSDSSPPDFEPSVVPKSGVFAALKD